MNKLDKGRYCLLFTLLLFIASFCNSGYASESPQLGSRYEIVRTIYLMGSYKSLSKKQINKETIYAELNPRHYYDTVWVAFQKEVPVGTVMTIVSPAPKVWHIPFLAKRYFVRLSPDPAPGLEVVLALDRGLEGSLDGLNPKYFRPAGGRDGVK